MKAQINMLRDKLEQIIKDSAISRMKSLSHRADFTVKSIDPTAFVKDHRWMVLIMVFAKSVNIRFKVHFAQDSLKAFMEKNPDLREYVNNPGICVDFVKEYCNMVAGGIKQALENIDRQVGDGAGSSYVISLPQELEDEASQPPRHHKKRNEVDFESFFEFGVDSAILQVSSVIHIDDVRRLMKPSVDDLSKILVTDGGDIEFL